MYTVKNISDRRSYKRTVRDFSQAFKNEERVMSAMNAVCFSKGIPFDYQKIDKNEKFNDGNVHIVPDFFITINGVRKTYELKCSTTSGWTRRNNEEYIFVKPWAIQTMQRRPDIYPHGSLLCATSTRYAVVKAEDVMKFPLEDIPEWGNKRAYVLPVEDLDWKVWIFPIELFD